MLSSKNRCSRRLRGLALCGLALWAVFAAAVAADWPAERPTGGFAIDTMDRFLVRSFFNTVHRASVGTPMGWAGDVGTCTAGTTTDGFKAAVLARVNYHRAMAGVPASITLRPDFSDKAQQAALMMSANGALDHSPPETWACWSADGADAAANANLSLGNSGWAAVSSQMTDNGANNTAVGHRRWILYPPIQEMGTGDVPATGSGEEANALWVNDGRLFDPRPATREAFVAWPPRGFVPYPVVPARWSFSYPGADFSGATVTLTRGGQPVPVTLEPLQPPPGSSSFIGDPTLVWVPAGLDADASNTSWPSPAADTSYQVAVENVVVGGAPQDFAYQVTIIDPATPGASEAAPVVMGPAEAPVLGATEYAVTAVPHAIGYEVRTLDLTPHTGVEGAETGSGGIIDETDPSYPLISDGIQASGAHAFHLAHTDEQTPSGPPPSQAFMLADAFLLGARASLRFKSRMTVASPDQVARAQVSVDGGVTWAELYSQAGAGSPGESSFTQRDLPLADYVGRVARIRFIYEVPPKASLSWYPQTHDGVGFYVDDIELLDVQRVTAETVLDLGPDDSFDFTPGTPGTYGLQARAALWQGYPALDWAPATMVTTIDSAAALDITPASQPGYAGQALTFSIDYSNVGAAPLTGVVLMLSEDPLLIIAEASPAPDAGFSGRWTLPELAVGEAGAIEITVSLPDDAIHGSQYLIDATLTADQTTAAASAMLTVDDSLRDTDNDGDPDVTDPDDDGDGMGDTWEIDNGFDPLDAADADADADMDGLTNAQEHAAGTDPHATDTDGDGHPDGADVDPRDRMNPIPPEALPGAGGWRVILGR